MNLPQQAAALTVSRWRRLARLEVSHARLQRLWHMSRVELAVLLGGDPERAAAWIGSAAECGLPSAQLCLGRLLLQGHGVARNELAAFAWFERAALQADAPAMNMLGRCYENGWGVAADAAHAARWYRASAAGGHDWGQYNLANLYFDGSGLKQDRREALRWYLRAAHQGHARAMNLVGRCLEEGWGSTPVPAEADYWYRRSADAGYFRGQFNHALTLLQQGLAAQAAHWLWRAASGGDAAIREAIIAAVGGSPDAALRELAARVRTLD